MTSPRPYGRAEQAAALIESMARSQPAGSRLGTKATLRVTVDVSVGTFNEALRILQARRIVTVRPGPGGGLFTCEQPPMVRLGNSVLALDSDVVDVVGQAVRIRDALDPLLVEDALHHASPAHLEQMRATAESMREAAATADATAFVHANWALHRHIANASPHSVLSSLYCSLLELVEAHTLEVLPLHDAPLPEYLLDRYKLHFDLVEAIAARDRETAIELITMHSTTKQSDGELAAYLGGRS